MASTVTRLTRAAKSQGQYDALPPIAPGHHPRLHEPEQAAKFALRAIGCRVGELDEEITQLDAVLKPLVAAAALCGASPIPASSGKTNRHRLNYGGDRDANRALHMIAVCRLRYCQRTRAYTERRTAEGKTKNEIIRCLSL